MTKSQIDQDAVAHEGARHRAAYQSTVTADRPVQVLLCGGPAEHLPHEERVHSVPDEDSVIKLSRGAHYDHYAPTAEHIRRDGRELRIFAWSHRTFVAE